MRVVLVGLLFSLISTLSLGQTTVFYSDRALGVNPLQQTPTFLSYAQVRVCSLPLNTTSPCAPVAAITDQFGNSLSINGGNFGQLTTDVVGRFTFGCSPGSYLVQVAATGSNTPQLSYPITCPSGTSALLSSANVWAQNQTMSSINNILFVDGVKYSTCNSAITAMGATIGVVYLPSGYVGPACSSVPANVTIWDLTGLAANHTESNVCNVNSFSGSGLHSMFRCWEIVTNPNAAGEVAGYFGIDVTGANPGGDGMSGECNVIGAITGSVPGCNGAENIAIIRSTGGAAANVIGEVGYGQTWAGSTTAVTNVIGVDGLGCEEVLGSVPVNCYGLVAEPQAGASGDNMSLLIKGNWKQLNNTIRYAGDHTGANQDIEELRSDDSIQEFPLSNAGGWRFSTQSRALDLLVLNSNGVSTQAPFAFGNHINQAVTKEFAGTCAMAAGTSCTFTLVSGAFSSTPICISTVQSATVIASGCTVSGTTVTITAASSNSLTWGAMLVGNPN